MNTRKQLLTIAFFALIERASASSALRLGMNTGKKQGLNLLKPAALYAPQMMGSLKAPAVLPQATNTAAIAQSVPSYAVPPLNSTATAKTTIPPMPQLPETGESTLDIYKRFMSNPLGLAVPVPPVVEDAEEPYLLDYDTMVEDKQQIDAIWDENKEYDLENQDFEDIHVYGQAPGEVSFKESNPMRRRPALKAAVEEDPQQDDDVLDSKKHTEILHKNLAFKAPDLSSRSRRKLMKN